MQPECSASGPQPLEAPRTASGRMLSLSHVVVGLSDGQVTGSSRKRSSRRASGLRELELWQWQVRQCVCLPAQLLKVITKLKVVWRLRESEAGGHVRLSGC
eukprot:1976597-Rhodomonas_salina.2